MEIILRCSNVRRKDLVEQEFFWYDSLQKKMTNQKAGGMSFRYDPSERRMVPHFSQSYEYISKNNYEEINKWVKSNENKYDISIMEIAPNYSITIEAPALNFDSMVADLYRKQILFDFDEKELKSELIGRRT